jgi:carbon storage regulator CsrA
MLILARHRGERIFVDDGRIVIDVVEILPDKVRLGFTAPPDCRVDREEVHRRRAADAAAAAGDDPDLSLT